MSATIQRPPGNNSSHALGSNSKGPFTKNFLQFQISPPSFYPSQKKTLKLFLRWYRGLVLATDEHLCYVLLCPCTAIPELSTQEGRGLGLEPLENGIGGGMTDRQTYTAIDG